MSISNGSFQNFAAREGNPGYEKLIARQTELYHKPNDCRDPFERDYTRILQSPLAGATIKKIKTAGGIRLCTRWQTLSTTMI